MFRSVLCSDFEINQVSEQSSITSLISVVLVCKPCAKTSTVFRTPAADCLKDSPLQLDAHNATQIGGWPVCYLSRHWQNTSRSAHREFKIRRPGGGAAKLRTRTVDDMKDT